MVNYYFFLGFMHSSRVGPGYGHKKQAEQSKELLNDAI